MKSKSKFKIQLIIIVSLFTLWTILGYLNFFDERIMPDIDKVFLKLISNINYFFLLQ